MHRLNQQLMLSFVVAGIALIGGCTALSDGSVSSTAASQSDDAVALASYDSPAVPSSASRTPGGPIELSDFAPSNLGATVKKLSGKGPDPDIARRLFDEAESVYRQAAAAKAEGGDEDFADTFLEAGEKYAGAAGRWPDSALEENALFRAGECQFQADRYVKANEYFEELLKKYPNSRYLDPVGARRFVIAKYWIDLDTANGSPAVGLNLVDKQRPWSDTFGHAIRIYDRMRLDDPTGKLADDATIAAANALFTRGDFERADTYYSDLRMHFPNSEHQFMAHYLGIQSKIRAYRGPEFAGQLLDEAEKLVKTARKQFPNEAREHQEELEKAYREVRYRKAEREWTMAEYYRQRREYGAARFYLDIINDEYGDTPFADRAREQVAAITGKPRKPPQRLSWLVDLLPDGNTPEPRMATAPDDTTTR